MSGRVDEFPYDFEAVCTQCGYTFGRHRGGEPFECPNHHHSPLRKGEYIDGSQFVPPLDELLVTLLKEDG